MALSERKLQFVDAYIVDPNALRAAEIAKYKQPQVLGHRLLKDPEIQAELARRRELLTEKSEVTAEMVLRELGRIGFANIRDVVAWDSDSVTFKGSSELTADQAAAIAEVSMTTSKDGIAQVRLKLHDKKAALDSIGKVLGMFIDRSHNTNLDLTLADLVKIAQGRLTDGD